jgi:hypothetical protein
MSEKALLDILELLRMQNMPQKGNRGAEMTAQSQVYSALSVVVC